MAKPLGARAPNKLRKPSYTSFALCQNKCFSFSAPVAIQRRQARLKIAWHGPKASVSEPKGKCRVSYQTKVVPCCRRLGSRNRFGLLG
jgi:hypothetical protein